VCTLSPSSGIDVDACCGAVCLFGLLPLLLLCVCVCVLAFVRTLIVAVVVCVPTLVGIVCLFVCLSLSLV
jgi:hypothetical protein